MNQAVENSTEDVSDTRMQLLNAVLGLDIVTFERHICLRHFIYLGYIKYVDRTDSYISHCCCHDICFCIYCVITLLIIVQSCL